MIQIKYYLLLRMFSFGTASLCNILLPRLLSPQYVSPDAPHATSCCGYLHNSYFSYKVTCRNKVSFIEKSISYEKYVLNAPYH